MTETNQMRLKECFLLVLNQLALSQLLLLVPKRLVLSFHCPEIVSFRR